MEFQHAAATSSDLDASRPRGPPRNAPVVPVGTGGGASRRSPQSSATRIRCLAGRCTTKWCTRPRKRFIVSACPLLRFNFRGVGLSEGTHDNGRARWTTFWPCSIFSRRNIPACRSSLAGFSFGSWVGLRAGCGDARVTELIGLGLPVGDLDSRSFSYLDTCDKPKLFVSGEFDRFGPPHKLREMVERFPAHVQRKHAAWRSFAAGITFSRGICRNWTAR